MEHRPMLPHLLRTSFAYWWLYQVVLSPLIVQVVRAYSTSVPENLVQMLTNRSLYNRHASPTQDMEIPTVVNISMYIEGISSFKAETMDFQVDIYFQERWVDARLSHNQTKRVLIKDNALFESMWHPDLYFANAKQASFHEVTAPNFLVWIHQNGTIYYDCRISLTVMCMQHLAKYPLDSQSCTLRILSYAYDIDQLAVHWSEEIAPIDTNPDIKMADMHLISIIPGLRKAEYITGTWSCATAQFNVQREIMHHVLQSYVPTALIVVISWFSFWLDVDAVPGRVSLSITTLLTLATQASAARLGMPQVSYIKAIDTWMGTCMGFVFGVMIEFTFVNYWTRRKGPIFPTCTCPLRDKMKHLSHPHGNCNAAAAYGAGPIRKSTYGNLAQNRGLLNEIEADLYANTAGYRHDGSYNAAYHQMSEPASPMIMRTNGVIAGGVGGNRGRAATTTRLYNQEESALISRIVRNRNASSAAADSEFIVGGDNGCSSARGGPSPTRRSTQSPGGGAGGELENWKTGVRKLQTLRRWRNRKVAQSIDQKSRWLFPLAFVLFNCVYWIYYLYIAE